MVSVEVLLCVGPCRTYVWWCRQIKVISGASFQAYVTFEQKIHRVLSLPGKAAELNDLVRPGTGSQMLDQIWRSIASTFNSVQFNFIYIEINKKSNK